MEGAVHATAAAGAQCAGRHAPRAAHHRCGRQSSQNKGRARCQGHLTVVTTSEASLLKLAVGETARVLALGVTVSSTSSANAAGGLPIDAGDLIVNVPVRLVLTMTRVLLEYAIPTGMGSG
jgi:hypothetical protein